MGVDEVVRQLQGQREEQRKVNAELAALRDASKKEGEEMRRKAEAMSQAEQKMRSEQQREVGSHTKAPLVYPPTRPPPAPFLGSLPPSLSPPSPP